MNSLMSRMQESPVAARVVPFVIFVVLTALQGQLGEASRYWIYALKTVAGAALIWAVWRAVPEMRWAFSWEAVVAGVIVFALWVGLDRFYPKFGTITSLWNPHTAFGEGSFLAWSFVGVRVLGSVLVVPMLEEVFYRSFLYRYLIRINFESVPFHYLHRTALGITALIFGFAHFEWLPGIMCALLYQALVLRKGRLGDAMTAHAITNLLLGLWVISKGAWHFW